MPTHIATVQGHGLPAVKGYTDKRVTPAIAQFIPRIFHRTNYATGMGILQRRDDLKPGNQCTDNDRAEVFTTGVNPTIPNVRIGGDFKHERRELEKFGIIFQQYKEGTHYYTSRRAGD